MSDRMMIQMGWCIDYVMSWMMRDVIMWWWGVVGKGKVVKYIGVGW